MNPSPPKAQACQHHPLVGLIMGSASDWPTMQLAANLLNQLCVPHEAKVVSAHRTPDHMAEYAQSAESRGLRLIIAGAGGAAHLPGMVAAWTPLPVLGVPIKSRSLNGIDSLLSIAQMPAGIPVATFAIGDAGAKNAAIFAARMLAREHPDIRKKLAAFTTDQSQKVLNTELPQ